MFWHDYDPLAALQYVASCSNLRISAKRVVHPLNFKYSSPLSWTRKPAEQETRDKREHTIQHTPTTRAKNVAKFEWGDDQTWELQSFQAHRCCRVCGMCESILHPRRCKTSSVGQSAELLIPRSSVRFRQKLRKLITEIYMDLSYINPQARVLNCCFK